MRVPESIRKDLLDRARYEVLKGIRGLIPLVDESRDAARREIADRRAAPHRWALFHNYMLETLPRWRWLARGVHRAAHRRMSAQAHALDDLAKDCTGAQLANRLKLPKGRRR